MTTDIGAEVASWLEQDIPGHIEHMIQIALVAERHRRAHTANCILVRSSCAWPISQPVAEVTPAHLLVLADEHEQMAETLLQDAAELRVYADALKQPTALGSAMHEHFRAMREEEAHRSTVAEEERQIADAPGGILQWEAVDEVIRGKLRWAGYVRVDDVREAFRTGALRNAFGIGPATLTKIAVALVVEGAV